MRRGMLACVAALAVCASGVACVSAAEPEAPSPSSDGGIGVAPTGPLNPSNPPGGVPIATGVRVGDAALLLWFGGTGIPVGLDSGWYDARTGQPVQGPQYTMGWFPTEPVPECFQYLGEMTLPGGDLLDVGWLIGPANAVVMEQGADREPAAIARWAPDPGRVVFWIRRHGRPVTQQDSTSRPGSPTFSAVDEHGATLCRQAFTSPDIQPRNDG